jgi:hypothetical protein
MSLLKVLDCRQESLLRVCMILLGLMFDMNFEVGCKSAEE